MTVLQTMAVYGFIGLLAAFQLYAAIWLWYDDGEPAAEEEEPSAEEGAF